MRELLFEWLKQFDVHCDHRKSMRVFRVRFFGLVVSCAGCHWKGWTKIRSLAKKTLGEESFQTIPFDRYQRNVQAPPIDANNLKVLQKVSESIRKYQKVSIRFGWLSHCLRSCLPSPNIGRLSKSITSTGLLKPRSTLVVEIPASPVGNPNASLWPATNFLCAQILRL